MIASIKRAQSIWDVVQYNEKKISDGKGRLLLGLNYPSSVSSLTIAEKIGRIQTLASLNLRVRKQCLHVILSFERDGKPDEATFCTLATDYMQRIGYGLQPCLVYEHMDMPHPHLHIVTTPVNGKGKRIPLNELIRQDSLQITLTMERDYDLRRTHFHKDQPVQYDLFQQTPRALEEEPVPTMVYGGETMGPSMAKILQKVLCTYQCTSLEELNALLRPYQLLADRGKPGSRIYLYGGLVYKALDKEGRPQGHYIKSSHLPGKPTLAFLQKRFEASRPEQAAVAGRVRTLIDWSLLPGLQGGIGGLARDLEAEGVQLHWQQGWKEKPTALVYLDHKLHWAVSEQVVGEAYTAPALLALFNVEQKNIKQALEQTRDQNAEGYARELRF